MAYPNALMKECRNGNVDQILRLIAHHDIDEQDEKGNSSLHYATTFGHAAVVQHLIEKGANINLQTEAGRTALVKASGEGHLHIVKILIGAGADINIPAYNGYTCLHCSVWQNHAEIVQYLLQQGISPDVQTIEGVTPLLIAAENGHKYVLSSLLKYDAKTNLSNIKKVTPVHVAAYKGHHATLEILLEHDNSGIDSRKDDGQTALHMAVYYGHFDIVALLLDKNADINVADNNSDTPLHFAVKYKQYEILQLLLQYSPRLLQNSEGKSALQLAMDMKLDSYMALLTDYDQQEYLRQEARQMPSVPSQLDEVRTNDPISSQGTIDKQSQSCPHLSSQLGASAALQVHGSQEVEQCARILQSNQVSKTKLSELQHNAGHLHSQGLQMQQTCQETHIWRQMAYIVPNDEDYSLNTTCKEYPYGFQAPDNSMVSLSCITIDMLDTWGNELDDILAELKNLQSQNTDYQTTSQRGWTPNQDFFKGSPRSTLSETTVKEGEHRTTVTTENKTTTMVKSSPWLHTQTELGAGMLDLRESREEVITVYSSDVNHPQCQGGRENMDRLEYRQAVTEYHITNALDILHIGRMDPPLCPQLYMKGNDNLDIGVLSTQNLFKIAQGLGHDWWTLGIQLGIADTKLEYIREDYNGRIMHGVIKMLLDWRMMSTKGYQETVMELREALLKTNKRCLVSRLPIH